MIDHTASPMDRLYASLLWRLRVCTVLTVLHLLGTLVVDVGSPPLSGVSGRRSHE